MFDPHQPNGDPKSLLIEDGAEGKARNIQRVQNGQTPSAPGYSAGAYTTKLRLDEQESRTNAPSKTSLQQGLADGAITDQGNEVILSLSGTPLPVFIDQMLRGVLNLNYIAPPDLQGTVNFKSTTPIPKSDLLAIVRDILASNGQAIKAINGIYYIAPPATLTQIASTVQAAGSADLQVKFISVGSGNPNKVKSFITPLLPPEIKIIPVPGSGALFVQATPSVIQQVEDLVLTVSESNIGNDDVVIIPLSQSAPEEVVKEVNSLYNARGESDYILLPLTGRPALMLSSSDKKLMKGIINLIQRLDVVLKSTVAVRVINLKSIPAKLAAEQLSASFGAKGGGGGNKQGSGSFIPADTSNQAGSSNSGAKTDGQGAKLQGVPTAPRLQLDSNEDIMQADASAPKTKFVPTNSNSAQDRLAAAEQGLATPVFSNADNTLIITPDERNNSLLVNSDFETFKRIQDLVEAIDTPDSQIVIEATIIEVELNDSLKYGVNWFLHHNGSGLSPATNFDIGSSNTSFAPDSTGATTLPSGNAPGGALTLTDVWQGNPVKVVVQGLQAVTNVKIVSSPYLTVLDGKEATLQIGQEVPFATAKLSTQTGATTQTVETKRTGIILKVAPRINGDNSVLLNITQEVSEADASASTGNLTPIISTRNITSNMVAFSGSTVALGGLIQTKTNKATTGVPVLSKVPVVGELFKQAIDTDVKTELMVLITPKVVRSSSDIVTLTKRLQRHISRR